jgi:hypothetical protein
LKLKYEATAFKFWVFNFNLRRLRRYTKGFLAALKLRNSSTLAPMVGRCRLNPVEARVESAGVSA